MKDQPVFSQEQLSAFIDGELDSTEKARILAASQNDKQLTDEIGLLQQYNDLIKLAYADIPDRSQTARRASYGFGGNKTPYGIAAGLLLVVGMAIGWAVNTSSDSTQNPIQTLANVDPSGLANEKVMIHINMMDPDRIDAALNKAEDLLTNAKQAGKHLQLEIVVNASGVNMLRQGSPYTTRIHTLTEQHDNVAFLACGFAMENIKMKEGREVILLPEAQKVDAALEQILRRLKMGWIYLRS